ncbi:MAG: protein kinase [Calditrichaeota bacterium]|nr:protein kinase [Calditrichota bacterium]
MTRDTQQELQQKYKILSQIARGGFSVIYRGVDLVFDKPIAIKAIDPKFLNDPEYVALFLSEARNAAKLSHPNIVNIYDLVQDDKGAYYIVMEYVEGMDLGKILAARKKSRKVLPTNLTVYIVKEVCKALEYAHNKRNPLTGKPIKLVHRDISPSNIVISEQGKVKLIDFGIARLKFARQQKGEIVLSGKLPYMAPEFAGEAEVDRRADIFSLGMVFFEMLTGKRLFDPENSEQAVHLLRKYKPNRGKIADPKVPEKLRQVIWKMVQKKPDDRYYGANGVYQDLVEYLMENSTSVELDEELSDFLEKLDSSTPVAQEKSETLVEKKSATSEEEVSDKRQGETKVSQKSPGNGKSKLSADSISGAAEKKAGDDLDKILTEIETEYAQEKRLGIARTAAGKKAKTDDQVKFARSLKLADPDLVEVAAAETEDDGEKTIIDVVRLSAHKYRKFLKYTALGMSLILLAALTADIYYQLSPLGTAIYTRFFSSKITLVTVPLGARVYLDGQRLSGTTPLTIPPIEPGVHRLTLSLEGFSPISRALHIPREGQLKIAGADAGEKGRTYIFHFKSTIELDSEPPGSIVFVNGAPYPEKTPTTIEWEAGKPLQLVMELPEFGRIEGLTIDIAADTAFFNSADQWTFERVGKIVNKYRVLGKLLKMVQVSTIPESVACLVDGKIVPPEKTGTGYKLALSGGVHEVLFKKEGFNDKLITLDVGKVKIPRLSVVMDRPVQIFARQSGTADTAQVAANVVKFVASGKTYPVDRVTPCKISIPAVDADIFLEKEGFEPLKLIVPADAQSITADLQPTTNPVRIFVRDALTGLPLKNAKIYYRTKPDTAAPEITMGATDKDGIFTGFVPSGEYFFKAEKSGYYNRQLKASVTDSAKIEFKLIIH